MEAYFAFLKQAGSHLDKKTAALISVITKVHAKTPNGVRQYLPRALKAGASADEVIDALLMAMPALGFSKIVWAIEVILEMNLPEFARYADASAPAAASEWKPILNLRDLNGKTPRYVKIGTLHAYVLKRGDGVIVYDAHCPHKGNLIPETGVADGELVCPFHEWNFDLASGNCTHGGTKPLRVIDHKIDGENIMIKI